MPLLANAKLIAAGLLCLGVFGVLVLVAHQRTEIADQAAQLLVLKADIQKDAQVNSADQGVITDQGKALALWQDVAAKAARAEVGARADLAAANAAQAVTKTHYVAMEKSDAAIPACADVQRMDLSQLCPGTVAALRLRSAASHLPGPGRADPGAGDAAARR